MNENLHSGALSYHFEIILKSWSKRRKVKPEPQAISVTIADFRLVEQHFCTMQVTYDDGTEQSYYSRVLLNAMTGQWTVDGMQVAVKVIIPDKS